MAGEGGARRFSDSLEGRRVEAGPSELCALCAASGVNTLSEKYHDVQLEYCTFHYWLIHGGRGEDGYSLRDYTIASEKGGFRTSLPSLPDCERMLREEDGESTPEAVALPHI